MGTLVVMAMAKGTAMTGEGRRDSLRIVRRVVVVGWVAWLVIGLLGVAAIQLAGPTAVCEHEAGESTYGELSWSVVPPGRVCTWTVEQHGFDDRAGPTPLGSIWMLGLLAGACVSVGLRRVGHRADAEDRDGPVRA